MGLGRGQVGVWLGVGVGVPVAVGATVGATVGVWVDVGVLLGVKGGLVAVDVVWEEKGVPVTVTGIEPGELARAEAVAFGLGEPAVTVAEAVLGLVFPSELDVPAFGEMRAVSPSVATITTPRTVPNPTRMARLLPRGMRFSRALGLPVSNTCWVFGATDRVGMRVARAELVLEERSDVDAGSTSPSAPGSGAIGLSLIHI